MSPEQTSLPKETQDLYHELGAEALSADEQQALKDMEDADRAERTQAIKDMSVGTLPELTIDANGVVAATEQEAQALKEAQEYGQGGPRA